MPLLSIIIPSFQASATMDACLQSIARQKGLEQVEILVQDGVSTDDTAAIVHQYTQLPILWQQMPDAGVYDAMNKAIQRSSGTWLYFLGADDTLHDDDALTELLAQLEQCDADLLHAQAWLKNAGYMHGGPASLQQLLFEGNLCHQAVCYRRHLFDRLGMYQLRYSIWADWEFNIRCFRYPPLQALYWPRPLAVYNDQAGHSRQPDPVFSQELPCCIKADYESEIAAIKKSISYRLGRMLFGWLDALRSDRS
jgi:glycosyltransferase involved in cell wall biosynthesis